MRLCAAAAAAVSLCLCVSDCGPSSKALSPPRKSDTVHTFSSLYAVVRGFFFSSLLRHTLEPKPLHGGGAKGEA